MAELTPGLVNAVHDDSDEEANEIAQSLRGPVRLRTLNTLRWLAVAGQAAAIGVVHFGLGFPLPLGFSLGVIAASAWLNLFTSLRFSPQRFLTDREATLHIAFDTAQLTALLFLTGGLLNPFAILMLAPVTIAASVLPLRGAALIAAMAFVGVSFLAVFHLPLPWREDEPFVIPRLYYGGVWAALSLAVGFFAAYAHRIAAEASEMKSALAASQLVLAREERLAAIGGLAAAAAHELGTPLATIQLTAREMAHELRGKGALEEDARLLVSQAQRCREILSRLSNRGDEGDAMLDRVAVDLLAREAAGPFMDRPEGPAVIFEMLADPAHIKPPVLRRRPEIVYGLRNFIENASGFAISKVLITSAWTADRISVSVHDDGPGFAPEILSRLGEPYVASRFRARGGSKSGLTSGLGLGFFIAKTLLERTGARVAFGNRAWPEGGQEGAWVEVSWPRAAVESSG